MSSSYRVPQKAFELVQSKKRQYKKATRHPIFQNPQMSTRRKVRFKKEFLRSGVDWVWEQPRMLSWSYFTPIPGRRTDRNQRIKVERIAEAMNCMPDLIAQFREDSRQYRLTKRRERQDTDSRDVLIEAASQRLTDMRDLVTEFDELDDTWFDANQNYYEMQDTNPSTNTAVDHKHIDDNSNNNNNNNNRENDTEVGATDDDIDSDAENMETLAKATLRTETGILETGIESESGTDVDNDTDSVHEGQEKTMQTSVSLSKSKTHLKREGRLNAWKSMQQKRKEKSLKLSNILKEKPLLDPELDTLAEKDARLRVTEKLHPMDGDYEDGRMWNRERTMEEMAYLQQLANEPDLEKEQEKHDKKRVPNKK